MPETHSVTVCQLPKHLTRYNPFLDEAVSKQLGNSIELTQLGNRSRRVPSGELLVDVPQDLPDNRFMVMQLGAYTGEYCYDVPIILENLTESGKNVLFFSGFEGRDDSLPKDPANRARGRNSRAVLNTYLHTLKAHTNPEHIRGIFVLEPHSWGLVEGLNDIFDSQVPVIPLTAAGVFARRAIQLEETYNAVISPDWGALQRNIMLARLLGIENIFVEDKGRNGIDGSICCNGLMQIYPDGTIDKQPNVTSLGGSNIVQIDDCTDSGGTAFDNYDVLSNDYDVNQVTFCVTQAVLSKGIKGFLKKLEERNSLQIRTTDALPRGPRARLMANGLNVSNQLDVISMGELTASIVRWMARSPREDDEQRIRDALITHPQDKYQTLKQLEENSRISFPTEDEIRVRQDQMLDTIAGMFD